MTTTTLMTQDRQKKQDLGIFYTPLAVAHFIFDILSTWKDREDKKTKRWQSRKPQHFPSVIDPAVGEGIFLKTAVERGFTKPEWIFGLDIDENAVQKWKEINLLKQFGGNEDELDAHFFHQNGLEPIQWEQHASTYNSKLKKEDMKKQQFNAVVGNPPYGGIGVDLKSPGSMRLLEALRKYEIFGWKLNAKAEQVSTTASMFGESDFAETTNYTAHADDVVRLAEGMPIEVLFVERFIQLAKPGGWIAVVIPDGILSNSNAHYVRDFIAAKSKVEAVVSLPRETFKQTGTSAKTSILFLRKLTENESPPLDHPVFLATADKISKDDFQNITKDYIN